MFVIAAIKGVLFLVLAWFFLPAAQTPLTITALLKELSGKVDCTRSGTARMAAYSGLQLQAKDKVYTATNGRVRLDLSDGSITCLGPNTLFVMGGAEGVKKFLVYTAFASYGEGV